MEMTLLLNGYEIVAEVEDQARTVLGVASGRFGARNPRAHEGPGSLTC